MTEQQYCIWLRSLGEAQAFPDGVAILQALDDALFVVVPAAEVRVSETDLRRLGRDLQARRWPSTVTELSWGAVYYARIPIGGRVPGIAYSARYPVYGPRRPAGIWISEEFIAKGLESEIRVALEGH